MLFLTLMGQPLFASWPAADTSCLPIIAYKGVQWNVHGVSDTRNGAIMVWQDRRDDIADKIYGQRVDATGGKMWNSTGIQLSYSAGFQYYPQMRPDGSGGAFIVWEDNRTGSDYDIYAQHVAADGTLLWGSSAAAVCAFSGHQYNPQLIPAGDGGIIVVWQDKRNGPFDIYAQRLNAAGSTVWSSGGQVICMADQDQVEPQLASDGFGGAFIAWTDYRANTTFPDIYAQHITADGSIPWPFDGIPICRLANTQWKVQIVTDGNAGAIITWQDRRSGTVDQIYGQRIDWSGTSLWQPGGIPLCTAQGIQYNQQMVSDNAGGAFIVWQDNRTGSEYDIYAQHVSTDGQLVWSPLGAPICTVAGQQYFPEIIFNGSNVLFTWQDKRSGTDYDIYCQAVDINGTLLWSKDGRRALRSTADQVTPQIIDDGAGGAICAWQDYQSGDGTSDISAQRFGANGELGGGMLRSFTQAEYAVRSVRFVSKLKGITKMPTVGNARDSLFLRFAFPDGIIIGVDRTADKKYYGWIKYSNSNGVRNALPQSLTPRKFDMITSKRKFVGALKNPTATTYNNQLVGELLTLHLNIAASDYGFTAAGFGDLIFNDPDDPTNPLNHRPLRKLILWIDSTLTMWQEYPSVSYVQMAATLHRINSAFSGPLDTLSTSPLKFSAVKSLYSYNFLATGIPLKQGSTVAVGSLPIQPGEEVLPTYCELLQNYPNPFNPSTQIGFTLTEPSIVTLAVYNVLGQEIVRLFDHAALDEGFQAMNFDGSRVASGTYFYRLTISNPENGRITGVFMKKMELIK